jgi:hypothetical protein
VSFRSVGTPWLDVCDDCPGQGSRRGTLVCTPAGGWEARIFLMHHSMDSDPAIGPLFTRSDKATPCEVLPSLSLASTPLILQGPPSHPRVTGGRGRRSIDRGGVLQKRGLQG